MRKQGSQPRSPPDLGVSVPPGIVVTNAALEAFLDEGALRGPIAELCRDLEIEELARPGERRGCHPSDDRRGQAMSPAALGDRRSGASSRTAGPFIVRSSARGEDSDAASFAGQLDSIGDVPAGSADRSPREGLGVAVVASRARLWNRQGRVLDGMGVVIQLQVASRWSGVLFSKAPDDPTQMLVEFCSGMGDALVSGRNNPGRLAIARDDFRFVLEAEPEDCRLPLVSLVNERDLSALRSTALGDRGSLRSTPGHRVDDRCRRPALDRAVAPDHGAAQRPPVDAERRAHVVS